MARCKLLRAPWTSSVRGYASPRQLGLAGWGYHAKNEYVEIDSIMPYLYLTTRMLQQLERPFQPGN